MVVNVLRTDDKSAALILWLAAGPQKMPEGLECFLASLLILGTAPLINLTLDNLSRRLAG